VLFFGKVRNGEKNSGFRVSFWFEGVTISVKNYSV
jgi:hypothetical protein